MYTRSTIEPGRRMKPSHRQTPPPQAAFPTNGVVTEAGRRLAAVLATGCGTAAEGEEAFPGVLSPLSNTLHILAAAARPALAPL